MLCIRDSASIWGKPSPAHTYLSMNAHNTFRNNNSITLYPKNINTIIAETLSVLKELTSANGLKHNHFK